MHSAETDEITGLYPLLPQIGVVLERPEVRALLSDLPRGLVLHATRSVLTNLRQEISAGRHTRESLEGALKIFPASVAAAIEAFLLPSLRPVLNATGVMLHTGLGRAPLSEKALANIAAVAGGYCNLELELASGERGRRDSHVESLLLRLLALLLEQKEESFLEQRSVIIVNNCAAATLLVLNSLAEKGEVIVSRGELVEIGGGFRVPEIMAKSGALLRETGTTNRTRVDDYARAITPATKLILRVHQSNFRIEGFSEMPDLEQLVHLADLHALPLFEDQGTGAIVSLEDYGIQHESSLLRSIRRGVSVVAASGDKLLGGPQCGILVGRRDLMEKMRTNPLLRAFRVDKLTYAALEATLLQYLSGQERELPLLKMLALDAEAVRLRCEAMAPALQRTYPGAEVVPAQSLVGGGTTPGASLPSFALSLAHHSLAAHSFSAVLRDQHPPVLARISEDRVLFDLRTVPPESDGILLRVLLELGAHRQEEAVANV